MLLAIATVPAIINVGIGYVTRDSPRADFTFITYREYVGVSSALLLFVALTAPDVVCPDRRHRVLPLIFARPLVGTDYVLAKVGAISTILFAFSFLPQVVLFVGQMLVSKGALDYVTDNAAVLWQVPLSVFLLAIYYGAIGVAVSSLTSRRIVGGVAILGLALVPSVVTGIILDSGNGDGTGTIAVTQPARAAAPPPRPHLPREHRPRRPPRRHRVRRPPRRHRLRRRARRRVHDPVPPLPPARRMNAYDPAFADDATLEVRDVSVWFGPKVALSELSCSFGPGVTGLLGPNGAGKTTLMRAMTGLISPNTGSVTLLGSDPRTDREVQRSVALVPEDEAVPPVLTARQLVKYVADLHGVADDDAIDRSLDTVGLLDVADRRVGGFSKGMRQRTKVAAALVTDPRVLVLDEPLNGADPVQRAHLITLFRSLGQQGRTVIVSSHVLHEVERLAERQIVLVRGRLAAAGGHRAIRDAMADRPRRVLVRTPTPRVLAAALLDLDAVSSISIDASSLVVASNRARDVAIALPQLARSLDARLEEVRPLDDSLESMFRELVT